MRYKETIKWTISGLALLISLASLWVYCEHNKRILDQNDLALRLTQVKLYSEIGTLEDIARKKEFLKKEHEEKRSAIFDKWKNIQSERSADYANRGLSNSGFFEQMKRNIEIDRSRELTAEDRDFQDRLRDLGSREKLIKDKELK